MKRLTAVVLLFAVPVTAQGSVTSFGQSCGHAGGTQLSWTGDTAPGAVITVTAENLIDGALALCAIGFSGTTSAFGSLPIPLPTPPFGLGCALYTSAEFLLPMSPGAGGTASLAATLPPSLNNYHLFLQAIVGESSGELNASQALDVHVLTTAGGPGDVLGEVTLLATGTPVPNARVTLYTPTLTFFLETRTGTDGSYTLSNVPAGSYRLGVAEPGLEYRETAIAVLGGDVEVDLTLVPETHPGSWATIGTTEPETLDATDIAVLRPDGTVLYCHDTTDPILFDPATGASQVGPVSGSPQGCMNSTLLASGDAILVGGQDGAEPGSFTDAISWVKLFLVNDTWLQLPDMLAPTGRWYPGLARLADGDLLVMGGGTAPSAERTDTCEVFDVQTQTWNSTGTMGSSVEFPPAALLYDGRVLRTWGTEPELYDPSAGEWSPTGAFNFPSRGFPGHSDHSLIVLTDSRAAAIGINTDAEPAGTMVELYDPGAGTWSPAGSPTLRRYQSEVVYLPDGQILVQGGDETANLSPEPDVLGIVRRCDLLRAETGMWRRVADTPKFREYHAATLLIPDGRVITTGGTMIKFSAANPLSADIDAYSPPYLFRGVRPLIANLSDDTPSRGATLSFDVFPETQLTSAVLMGMQSTTHWVDGGIPRRLELSVTQTSSTAQVTLPTNPNLLPLGWYMLFGMVDDIPSEALILRVDS